MLHQQRLSLMEIMLILTKRKAIYQGKRPIRVGLCFSAMAATWLISDSCRPALFDLENFARKFKFDIQYSTVQYMVCEKINLISQASTQPVVA